jgi:branched-chain amino acid transport system permease protein
MIVTLGLGYVLQGGSALIFGGNPQTLPGTLARAKIDIGPLWFTWQDVLVLVVTLLLYGAVWLFTQRTRFGSVIRAVAEDPKLAERSESTQNSSISASSCSSVPRSRWGRRWWRPARRS